LIAGNNREGERWVTDGVLQGSPHQLQNVIPGAANRPARSMREFFVGNAKEAIYEWQSELD
jgi:hypothetical protein